MKPESIKKLYTALRRISLYQSPKRLKGDAEKLYGLSYEEALEMAYENMLEEACRAIKGVKPPENI